ncbi:ankyrin repeat domain-containing protein [Candidatus Jidaibacter acanthamoebae]|nr:ankyrin repeat domain-containing protein [Candidatus Jidaibacter acanthamoeba]
MVLSELESCDLKKIFENDSFKMCRIKDAFTDKIYYYVVNLQQAPDTKNLEKIFEKFINTKEPVAKVSCNSVLKLNSKELVIFIDVSPQSIREKVLNDKTDYPYTVSFKIAKYHAYISIKEKATGISVDFGLAPKVYGKMFGESYIRNETFYDKKHFKKRKTEGFGQEDLDEIFEREAREHISDWASMEIEIDVTAEQIKKVEIFLRKISKRFYNEEYILIGKNCVDFANKIFNILFGKGSFMEYCMDDSLELQDKGVLYAFLSAYPKTAPKFIPQILNALTTLKFEKNLLELLNDGHLSINTYSDRVLLNALDSMAEKFIGKKGFKLLNDAFFNHIKCFDDSVNTKLHVAAYNSNQELFDCFSATYLSTHKNSVNCLGESPLHIAAAKSYLFTEKLLKIGANPNLPNAKGLTPLHIAVASKLDKEEKYKIVEALLNAGANPNYLDVTGYVNVLVEAVKTDDVKLFQLVLNACYNRENLRDFIFSKEYGYNFGIDFTNPDGKNLARIAVDKNKTEMIRYFKINHYKLFGQKADDGHTPKEFEQKLEDWVGGELKYPFQIENFPFKSNQESDDMEKSSFEEQYAEIIMYFSFFNNYVYFME